MTFNNRIDKTSRSRFDPTKVNLITSHIQTPILNIFIWLFLDIYAHRKKNHHVITFGLFEFRASKIDSSFSAFCMTFTTTNDFLCSDWFVTFSHVLFSSSTSFCCRVFLEKEAHFKYLSSMALSEFGGKSRDVCFVLSTKIEKDV